MGSPLCGPNMGLLFVLLTMIFMAPASEALRNNKGDAVPATSEGSRRAVPLIKDVEGLRAELFKTQQELADLQRTVSGMSPWQLRSILPLGLSVICCCPNAFLLQMQQLLANIHLDAAGGLSITADAVTTKKVRDMR